MTEVLRNHNLTLTSARILKLCIFFLSLLYRCATMKPRVLVTPPGLGRTVACLTHLKSLCPVRIQDQKVGLQLLQPLLHSFVLEMLHANSYFVSGTEGENKTSFDLFSMIQMKRARLCCASDPGDWGRCFKGEGKSFHP